MMVYKVDTRRCLHAKGQAAYHPESRVGDDDNDGDVDDVMVMMMKVMLVMMMKQ